MGTGTRRTLGAGLLCLLVAGAAASCSEGGLTSVPGEDTPGQAAETREVVVSVSEFPSWRDSTFQGFATASTVPYVLAAQDSTFQSRALVSFREVPDTVLINAQFLPIDSVGEIFLRLTADTARSRQAGDSVTVSVFTLDRAFDPAEATWDRAAVGDPWRAGGELGRRLGRTRVGTITDTMSIRLDPPGDSLWRAWGESGGPPSMAVVVSSPSTRLFLRNAVLDFMGKPPEQDTLAPAASSVEDRTFIYDPRQEDPGGSLRLGGIPASRIYVEFVPPDSVAGVPLRGAQINRAELVFVPRRIVPRIFRPGGPINAVAMQLLADPFDLGAKTPIGGALSSARVFRLVTDSLAAGDPVAVDVTGLISSWAAAAPDSAGSIRVGLRPIPDGGRFGYWDFGSIRADSAELRPRLRLLFTPPTPFSLP